jgi:Family of unknown function (DUF5675)
VNLTLRRSVYLPAGTLGHLSVNGEQQYSTLEPPAPQFAAAFHAIPAGTYKVVLYPSPKFGRMMPLLEGIPGRSEIEIHWGNFPEDTKGCILIGTSQSVDAESRPAIWNTRAAFDSLFPDIEGAQTEGCTISVIDT